jgi:hypothetical protein
VRSSSGTSRARRSRNGEEGILVPANDVPTLAGAIRRLLASADEREKLGVAARRRQQAEFRLDRTLAALQDLYEALYWAFPHGGSTTYGRSRMPFGILEDEHSETVEPMPR